MTNNLNKATNKEHLPKVQAWTDGSSDQKTRAGSGVVLINAKGSKLCIARHTPYKNTSSQAEAFAVLLALRELTKPTDITIHTDSAYCFNAVNNWIHGWAKNKWKNSNKKEVGQKEIWKEVYELMKIHQVNMVKVPAHSGIELNELADKLANLGAHGYESRKLTTVDKLK
ncbi:RNase H family protein [Vibrio sp. 1863]|uniref:RNase H family protein n=1 Tax=Vibrio sp. 1863 TaxID=3074579 RepID=UPI0029641A38|nr:RNase H family protein [Vibrio sp. 1863]MDW2077398.1 RNase H family protein [Vibrio sp. 1863]